ncbi:MAG: hypothetical protein GY896_09930, partial [Gammaproteobacteria bacterium]|nr:hypothetical protein [Gammaproteobacteria bacterium]
ITNGGESNDIDFDGQMENPKQILFIPTPLPTSWIKSIYFHSADDKKTFTDDLKDLDNISANTIPLKINKTLLNLLSAHSETAFS